MNIILLGGPGSGKGTLSQNLTKNYKILHLSTGDLLRNAIKDKTDFGLQAKKFMDEGQLVPDDLIINIMQQKLMTLDSECIGTILDGFPRTISQAKALDNMVESFNQKIDIVFLLECPDSVVIDRICSRLVCPSCGRVANTHDEEFKNTSHYICSNCGNEMQQRSDDSIDTIKNRLEVYKKHTYPLIDYYKNLGIVKNIDASVDAATTLKHAKQYIDKLL